MPSWHDILKEIQTKGSTHDLVRRLYLTGLHELTGRNVILYYSGWLQKPRLGGQQVNDADKNGFMTVIHRMDRSRGLDLILHTPGGETAATESLVNYLRSMFGSDIRAIVPHLAMSAGTMIACACKQIIMGKHSSLGPIDPQFNGLPAHGIIEEFRRAFEEIQSNQLKIALWQPIIAKYHPTLIGECEKAIKWSSEMTQEWLLSGMFREEMKASEENARAKVERIVKDLSDHALQKSHARHLSADKCKELGLNVEMLEDDQELQDAVLSVHHACIHTLSFTNAFKIIENHFGVAYMQTAQQVAVSGPPLQLIPERLEQSPLIPEKSDDEVNPTPLEIGNSMIPNRAPALIG